MHLFGQATGASSSHVVATEDIIGPASRFRADESETSQYEDDSDAIDTEGDAEAEDGEFGTLTSDENTRNRDIRHTIGESSANRMPISASIVIPSTGSTPKTTTRRRRKHNTSAAFE